MQTVQDSVSNKQTETDSILKSYGDFQTDAPQPIEKGTQTTFNELTTEKDVQSRNDPFIFNGNE